MSLFSLFTKTSKKKPAQQTTKVKVVKKNVDPQIQEMIQIAEEKAKNILIEAKEDATHLEKMTQEELAELRQQYTEIKSELDKKQRGLTIQESIVAKKEHSVKKLTDLISETQKNIQNIEEDLVKNLVKKSSLEQKDAEQLIMEKFLKDLETNTQKDLKFQEEVLSEKSELIAQDILLQVMKHGATNYSSEYVPPIITFENPNEEQRILGKEQENLRFIESLSTVEITFDDEQHQLKLYCFNTIQREIVRVLLERLKKGGQVNQQKIKTLYQQTKLDLDRDMFEAGRYLCNQLRIFNLPREIVQTLGMFKYRYSYGQNMIIHTLEEAKIGIALSHELGANTDIVRLGCLFHDIGKVIYEDTNHVEAGVKFLQKFDMPKSVIACVAESHEDIPFSSIESMIVHVADSISGARPGARFDDYEGFLKHQQGLIDISTSHKGVTEAFVINGGREVRVMVDPDVVTDGELDQLATTIRDQVEEFSTYPGSIVINVVREFQSSELIA